MNIQLISRWNKINRPDLLEHDSLIRACDMAEPAAHTLLPDHSHNRFAIFLLDFLYGIEVTAIQANTAGCA